MAEACVLLVQEALDLAALDELLGDDLLGVFGLDLDVEGLLGEHLDDRPLLAEAEAAGLDYLDLVLEALGLGLADEGLEDALRSARTRSRRRRRRARNSCKPSIPPPYFFMMSAAGRS